MAENKELFVQRLNEALIECDSGYKYLQDEPLVYECEGKGMDKVERVKQGQWFEVNVTFDSLPAMMKDIAEHIFL